VEFAKRGGQIRLVCSPYLNKPDIEAIKEGYAERDKILSQALESEISQLLNNVDARNKLVAIATLISTGSLDIKIVLRPSGSGLYHEKLGVFTDSDNNSVVFRGSSNESWSAWHEKGNLESFDVYCSWLGGADKSRANIHKQYFEELWKGNVNGADVLPFPEIPLESLKSIAVNDLEQLEVDDDSYRSKQTSSASTRTPLPHQLEAIKNWASHDHCGILEHATGSGKTFTALTAMKDFLVDDKVCLVLVPSKLLLIQWKKELKAEIPNLKLLVAGSNNNRWKKPNVLESFSMPISTGYPRVILSSIQTARKINFRSRLHAGKHLMLVCDEVHRSGSSSNSDVLKINAGARLGLSATPKRYGDPDGTQKLISYFKGIISPPYTLADAIKDGRLVQYEYYPSCISLNAEETEKWDGLTKTINREVAMSKRDSSGTLILSNRLKMLLIQRSRIVKKASEKVRLAMKIVNEHFLKGQHWLIYCEDSEQLTEILSALKSLNFPAEEYHTSMSGSQAETLSWYENYGGILVSIRCLDEGVDIPQISHALILASSQNPREFIQRRGRVLRVSKDKPEKVVATIFDAIVVPTADSECDQTSMVSSELKRALEFSTTALNSSAETDIMAIAVRAGIELDELSDTGFEEEPEDG